jgi:hypothetical protein
MLYFFYKKYKVFTNKLQFKYKFEIHMKNDIIILNESYKIKK